MISVKEFIEENFEPIPEKLTKGYVAAVFPDDLDKSVDDIPDIRREFNNIFFEKDIGLTARIKHKGDDVEVNGKRCIIIEIPGGNPSSKLKLVSFFGKKHNGVIEDRDYRRNLYGK